MIQSGTGVHTLESPPLCAAVCCASIAVGMVGGSHCGPPASSTKGSVRHVRSVSPAQGTLVGLET